MRTIEIRCPINPQVLLTKLLFKGEKAHITEGNLIELACDRCKEIRRKQTGERMRVLHRYDLLGELVETVEEPIIDPRSHAHSGR